MKSIKKNLINVTILAAMLVLSMPLAYAVPFTDALSGGLIKINNFFESGNYTPYAKAIDFFFFALLFVSIYLMGVRYAFKEVKKPERVIAILLGLMTSFLLVLADISATILLPYVHWIFYILLFMLYWWLLKAMKSKFWRFVLALLLTILTIALMQGLYNYLTVPEVGGVGVSTPSVGGIGGFFSSLGRSFGGIDMPGISAPGIPDYLKNVFGGREETYPVTGPEVITPAQTPAPGEAEEKPEEEKKFPWTTLLIIVVILAALTGGFFGGRKLWRKHKKKKEGEAGEVTTNVEVAAKGEGVSPETQNVIEEMNAVITLKQEILDRIRKITAQKRKLEGEMLDIYHKYISKTDPAYFWDKESEEFKRLVEERNDAINLLITERELDELLAGVSEFQTENNELYDRIDKLLKDINKSIVDKTKNSRIKQLFNDIISSQGEEKIRKFKIIGLFWFEDILLKFKLAEWQNLVAVKFANVPYEAIGSDIESALKKLKDDFDVLTGGFTTEVFAMPSGQRLHRILQLEEELKREKGLINLVKRVIATYFLNLADEEEKEKEIAKLMNPDKLKYWLKEGLSKRWMPLVGKKGEQLKEFFEFEIEFYEKQLVPSIHTEMRYLQHMVNLIRYLESKEKSFTRMQELKVEFVNIVNNAEEIKVFEKEEAGRIENAIPQDRLIRIFTKLEQGTRPITCTFYVDKVKLEKVQVVEPKSKVSEEHPDRQDFAVIELKSNEMGALTAGEHIITFVALSYSAKITGTKEVEIAGRRKTIPVYEKGTGTYVRMDTKRIKINIMSGIISRITRLSTQSIPTPIPSESSILKGEITNTETKPIEGATIEVISATTGESKSTKSKNGGQYSISLVAGNYSIKVSANGYNEAIGTKTVSADSVITYDFTLEPIEIKSKLLDILSRVETQVNTLEDQVKKAGKSKKNKSKE